MGLFEREDILDGVAGLSGGMGNTLFSAFLQQENSPVEDVCTRIEDQFWNTTRSRKHYAVDASVACMKAKLLITLEGGGPRGSVMGKLMKAVIPKGVKK